MKAVRSGSGSRRQRELDQDTSERSQNCRQVRTSALARPARTVGRPSLLQSDDRRGSCGRGRRRSQVQPFWQQHPALYRSSLRHQSVVIDESNAPKSSARRPPSATLWRPAETTFVLSVLNLSSHLQAITPINFPADTNPSTRQLLISKQPMFQLRPPVTALPGRSILCVTARLWPDFQTSDRRNVVATQTRLSKFSYASEILEKHARLLETQTWTKRKQKARSSRPQKRTEIPPRSERPLGPSCSNVSPLLVVV